MAEEKKAEAPAEAVAASPEASAPVDTKPLKLFLIINLVVVIAALGVSVFTFIKLSKPQVTDISPEDGHAAAAGEHGAPASGEHGAAPASDGHGAPATGGGESEKKIALNRFVVNLANSGGASTVSVSFQVSFNADSDLEYAKTYQAKMRDVSISLFSSKSYEEMASIKGREELKEQMLVAFNSFFGDKAKATEILFTEFFLNSGG